MGAGLVEVVNLEQLPCAREVFSQTEVKYRVLLEQLNNSYALFKILRDHHGHPAKYVFQEANPAFEMQMGVTQAAVIGKDIADTPIGIKYLGIDWSAILSFTAQDGMPRIFEKYSPVFKRWFRFSVYSPMEDLVAVLFVDITLQKEKQQAAHNDPLIGLPAQHMLEDRLLLAITQAKRSREQLAVAIFELENYVPLVELYGDKIGDEFIREIARRTLSCLRQSDTVARISLDTFALILPGVKTNTFAVMVANRILECCRQPIELRGETIISAGTISLCFFPQVPLNFAETVSKADARMYLSKQRRFPQVCLSF